MGAIATVAMSAVMVAGSRAGLMREQPPVTIARTALGEAGVERPSTLAAVIAPAGHLAFGAAGGVTYGFMRPLAPHVSGRLLGVAFGLAVWLVSYKGWIPALRILPSPEADRPGRPTVMVAAHIVYGVVLGWLHG
jgi:Family of unknown function (DUF6789)